MMLSVLHPGVTSLALIYSSQLNLFEQFLTQAVSGIDSTSITSGMQNVGYVILVVGFLWQVYQSALHGGDVRGLGANLIKYVATAVVVMNYHAVFTTINQGFVTAGNWISNASGGLNLLDNWRTDIQTQFSQIGFQNLWGLVSDGVQPISVSLRGTRYEAMVLMTSKDWIDTGLGRWIVGEDCRSLVLEVAHEGGQS